MLRLFACVTLVPNFHKFPFAVLYPKQFQILGCWLSPSDLQCVLMLLRLFAGHVLLFLWLCLNFP